MNELPSVTVVMPIRNEAQYVRRSVGAVLAQDYPPHKLEVIVTDGTSIDGTSEILQELQAQHPNLRLVHNPGKIVPTGLNAAIAQARGKVIVRVDGHCEISPDYVRRCVEHLQRDGVDGVGGPLETVGETPLAKVIAVAMSSKFGVGGSAFRTTHNKTMLTDTVAFPAYTRAIMDKAGPYDEELVRNQDDEYNYRLRKIGARILLAADVHARYYSRCTLRSLWRQYFRYGFYKVRVMQKHPRQMRPRQFVPPTFVAALLGAGALALVTPLGRFLLAFIVVSYALANLATSILTARGASWRRLLLLPVVFATLHISYGLGFLVGLGRFWRRWGDFGSKAPTQRRISGEANVEASSG